jgi:hypothetical protein
MKRAAVPEDHPFTRRQPAQTRRTGSSLPALPPANSPRRPISSSRTSSTRHATRVDQARLVIVLAQAQARERHHPCIGTGHLLLGLLIQGSGPAADVLAEAGITWQRAERELLRMTAAGEDEETPRPGDHP